MNSKVLTRLKDYVFEQKCIPWFVFVKWGKLKRDLDFLKIKFDICFGVKILFFSKIENPKISFLISHKNCAIFIKLCIESIRRYSKDGTYEIVIADDCSAEKEFEEIKQIIANDVTLYRFRKTRGHCFSLEWLFQKARAKYVIILDQDTILVSNLWQDLIDEFKIKDKLLMIGMRDQCALRNSPLMVHPSFALINKERCKKFLKSPFFFGDKPLEHLYKIDQAEEYHALSCKCLAFNEESIEYLDAYQTKYGYGSVGYYGSKDRRVMYHQWYSGRIHSMSENSTIDDYSVKSLRDAINKFLIDYQADRFDLTPVNL